NWQVIGLETSDLEANDYLLDWQRDGYALRYVHFIDESETQNLASDGELILKESFLADGHTNNLTLYARLTRP
ncbi:MAG: hypothetical protein P1S60_12600, partial [Anaerolineae bacterium]|nr:hypothetical protein [Anaerolineae bacterium]